MKVGTRSSHDKGHAKLEPIHSSDVCKLNVEKWFDPATTREKMRDSIPTEVDQI